MKAGKIFRAEDWWIGKASLLMGMVYMLSALFDIRFGSFALWAACSMATIIGFASLGYLLNDYFDRDADRLAGKKNFLLGKGPAQLALFFLIAVLLLALPWYFLPWDVYTLGMMAAQLLAYFLYSVPPIRVKERGAAGILADALYAHGIPAVMATYTYMLISGFPPDILLLALLFAWQLTAGLRNVLLHQLDDMPGDARSGTSTYATQRGGIPHGLIQGLRIAELLLLIALLVYCALWQPAFVWALPAVAFSLLVCARMRAADGYRRYYPNILYDQWLPYTFIIILSLRDIRYLLLLPLHGLLFSREIISELYHSIPWSHYTTVLRSTSVAVADRVRLAANWLIYLIFRLAGIDLIKEQTDAIGYIRRRMHRHQR
ncbi:MAG: UbiA family prenyltransferase [Bacteroidetes bacterium]|nr:UbiA family prenyltransferase [Bacteroidota bacterium]